MKKVGFYSLGCKVNTTETFSIMSLFLAAGYEINDFDSLCDVYVINTCCVTAMSGKKSRQVISRAKKNNPNAIVVAMGCYSQTNPLEIAESTDVDIIIGTTDRKDIINILERFEIQSSKGLSFVRKTSPDDKFEEISSHQVIGRTRASIKIQDGCNAFCSYCIIPYARGRSRSRSFDSIIDEARELVARGFSDISLIAIHLASYGKDLSEGKSLVDILEVIDNIPGIRRIRLGSLSPSIITNKFINQISQFKNFCRHFHISLQSGCDTTLKQMNRRYSMSDFFDCLNLIKELPDVSVTTDIIVGFPGETEEHFAESLANISKCGFSHIHIFPYSVREGTVAANMPNQVDEATKKLRVKRLTEVANRSKHEFLSQYIGSTLEVLFEENNEGLTQNYLRVHADDFTRGEGLYTVLVTDIGDDMLIGRVVD